MLCICNSQSRQLFFAEEVFQFLEEATLLDFLDHLACDLGSILREILHLVACHIDGHERALGTEWRHADN